MDSNFQLIIHKTKPDVKVKYIVLTPQIHIITIKEIDRVRHSRINIEEVI